MENTDKPILAVLAHPDDETFGMGGTLALYARRGASVHLVCATRGEVGTVDPALLQASARSPSGARPSCAAPPRSWGWTASTSSATAIRACPARRITTTRKPWLQPTWTRWSPRIVPYIRSIRPQVVITFDPIGGYKHPDHIAIHQATVKAFQLAGDPSYRGRSAGFPAEQAVLPDYPQRLPACGGVDDDRAGQGPAPLRAQPGYRPGVAGG